MMDVNEELKFCEHSKNRRGRRGGRFGSGDQGGCVRRIEVFMKIQKKESFRGWGVRAGRR